MPRISPNAIVVRPFAEFRGIAMQLNDISASNRGHWNQPMVSAVQPKSGRFWPEMKEFAGNVFRRMQISRNVRSIQVV
jgi:hypothetical protein